MDETIKAMGGNPTIYKCIINEKETLTFSWYELITSVFNIGRSAIDTITTPSLLVYLRGDVSFDVIPNGRSNTNAQK